MPEADNRCPRCDAPFHCGVDDAEPCACTRLNLDAALLADLRQRYTGCLCLACLREIGGKRDQATAMSISPLGCAVPATALRRPSRTQASAGPPQAA
ncbi:MAG: cysteine-rich CWC family protein [Burkholderiaceae bacterium]|nr:cysteine-rich CWC family protein [Burkholderiaceae bacterium]